MGLLDDYQIDMDEVETSSGFKTIPDDTYRFAVGDAYIREVAAKENRPAISYLIISYLLADEEDVATGDAYDEWFGLPQDTTARTQKENEALGRYKSRLISLGIAPEDVNSVGADELVNIRGIFSLVSSKAKNSERIYQNIRNLSLAEEEEAEEEAPAPVKAVAKAPVRAAATAGKSNPFAKK